MNVMVYNKYKDLLLGLKLDIMKSIEGVFNVDEIIDTFANFYYDKMILDITAIRDYQNIDNLQKLAMNINMENVILLLDNTDESNTQTYLSKLISLGIYNFTRNADGINYLLVHPHTYKDVANIHNLDEVIPNQNSVQNSVAEEVKKEEPKVFINNVVNERIRIIGFKDVTNHAGATTLIYMLKKSLQNFRKIAAIEINKMDFLYFNDPDLISTTTNDFPKELMQRNSLDYIFVDLNDYNDLSVCNEVYYLIEPSTIMLNKMMKKNKNIFELLKGQKIILNKCVLSDKDVVAFEYETKLKVVCSIPPCDERKSDIDEIKKFVNKINL